MIEAFHHIGLYFAPDKSMTGGARSSVGKPEKVQPPGMHFTRIIAEYSEGAQEAQGFQIFVDFSEKGRLQGQQVFELTHMEMQVVDGKNVWKTAQQSDRYRIPMSDCMLPNMQTALRQSKQLTNAIDLKLVRRIMRGEPIPEAFDERKWRKYQNRVQTALAGLEASIDLPQELKTVLGAPLVGKATHALAEMLLDGTIRGWAKPEDYIPLSEKKGMTIITPKKPQDPNPVGVSVGRQDRQQNQPSLTSDTGDLIVPPRKQASRVGSTGGSSSSRTNTPREVGKSQIPHVSTRSPSIDGIQNGSFGSRELRIPRRIEPEQAAEINGHTIEGYSRIQRPLERHPKIEEIDDNYGIMFRIVDQNQNKENLRYQIFVHILERLPVGSAYKWRLLDTDEKQALRFSESDVKKSGKKADEQRTKRIDAWIRKAFPEGYSPSFRAKDLWANIESAWHQAFK